MIKFNLKSVLAAGIVTLMTFSACKKKSEEVKPSEARGIKPAVMLSTIAWDPDGRKTYVGAYSDVPSGSVDSKNMKEFGDAYFYTFDGSIFVWERDQVKITRYEVSDDLKLTQGGSISLQSFGFKYGADLTFVSPTKAIMMVAEQNKVIIWNPSTMKVTTSFDANLPVKAGFDSWPGQIGISGQYMYYSLFYYNYDNLKLYPKMLMAVVPLDGSTNVTVFEDDRTLPGTSGYIDKNGDIYMLGSNDCSAFKAYSSEGGTYPNAGILRIPAGQTFFDPSYYLDLNKITGSKALIGDWKIDDDHVLCRVYDSTATLPASYDEYYGSKNFVSKKVNIKTGKAEDYPALPKGGFSSNIQDWVDNMTYFSLPNADGSAEIAYRLKNDGIDHAFQIPGAGYWGMKRIR